MKTNTLYKRSAANERERQRMKQLNEAYLQLKHSLPWIPNDTKLTKLEILLFAIQYIYDLTWELDTEPNIAYACAC